MGGRHAHVEHHELGVFALDDLRDPDGVADRADDRVAVIDEHAREPVAEQRGIFDDDYAHGRSAATTVGPPVGLVIRRLPSTDDARSASPASPPPGRSSAPPTPSSATSMCSLSPCRRTLTSTAFAFA